MTALLIVAHGSRKKESNQEILRLTSELARISKDHYETVQPAFIQFGEPSFDATVDLLVQKGIKEIKVLPYFIAAGSHVQQDIPELVQNAKARHPETAITLMTHFGNFSGIAQFMLDESLRQ